MQVVAFNASPRTNGNSALLLARLLQGARDAGASTREFRTGALNLRDCRGCLRCNVLKRCSLRGDDWPALRDVMLQADALVFAAPVYFHHVPASMKRLLDRFRSFVHVQITADGLQHTPWHPWRKRFVLLMSMGSPDTAEARPVCELMSFITRMLGPDNTLRTILGGRLAGAGQISLPEAALGELYGKLGIPASCASVDAARNRALLEECYRCGRDLAQPG
jgi:NAD(P)H-dependent FMN reductase